MEKSEISKCVDLCLRWIESQMLTFNHGSSGVYERIRIDENIRVENVRPDCSSEVARVLSLHREVNPNSHYDQIYKNIISWVLKVQDNDPLSAWYGSFPFYRISGSTVEENGETRYQNDNGKVLICLLDLYELTKEQSLLQSAVRLADYWVGIQRPEGTFNRKDGLTCGKAEGPCFIFWLAAGLYQCYALTRDEKYRSSAKKALDFVLRKQLPDGRFQTSYEILGVEDWRPVSSESAIAVFCLSRVLGYEDDPTVKKALENVTAFLLSLQHPCGGILNCNSETLNASLQNNEKLCDLVYTQGFALMGLVEAYRALGGAQYLEAAKSLGSFLIKIQCRNESPLWDGAWRGSFHVEKWCWDGRADQNNKIDEGGMYSAYTGWCAATILYGLLTLEQLL